MHLKLKKNSPNDISLNYELNISAQTSGKFEPEMITMSVKGKKGSEEFKVDEHPRPQATKEQLAKLPPVFKKDGTATAGNASVRHCLEVSRLIIVSRINHLEENKFLIYFRITQHYTSFN